MNPLDSASNAVAPLKVEMWGDLQCAWCYIEFSALTNAARELGGVDVRFRTYSLFPDGVRANGASDGDPTWFHAGIANLAAELGLGYDAANLQRTGSQQAHELVHLATAHGMPTSMVNRLFEAHFVDGQDIGDEDTLVRLAVECGLDEALVADALRDGTYSAAVEWDNHLAYLLGAAGVPFAVINGKYTLTGIQTAGTVRSALLLARNAQGAPL